LVLFCRETDFMKFINKTILKSFIFFVIKIIIAAGIIYWLIHNNYNDFIKAIQNIDAFWLVVAVFLYLFMVLASALRWFLLLKLLKIDIHYYETFSLNMQGYFFSLVIPGGSLGGDLVKTGFLLTRLPKGRKLEATSTIFMDRFLGMLGQFFIGIIMGIICIPLIMEMDYLSKITTIILIFLSLVGILVGMTILFHRKLEKIKLFARGINVVDKYSKGFVSRITGILDVYSNSKKTLINCILVGVVFIQCSIVFIFYFIALGIHSSFIPIKSIFLAVSIGNTMGLLPITPSGIGTRDAITKSILNAGGFIEGDAVVIPLLYTSIMILFSLFGGLFFIFTKNKKKSS
jgi:glycosyltransferase 2 family protein